MTKRWKLVIFSSKSSGSFWAILVFCHNTKFLLQRNLVDQLFIAWKFDICWSLAIALAFIWMRFLVTIYPLLLWSSIHFTRFSSKSGHWQRFPRSAHLFFGMHLSFSTWRLQSLTSFSLTQNSLLAAQLFDCSANRTMHSLNFAEYFKCFEDILQRAGNLILS